MFLKNKFVNTVSFQFTDRTYVAVKMRERLQDTPLINPRESYDCLPLYKKTTEYKPSRIAMA